MGTSYMEFVALLAEGVDRNITMPKAQRWAYGSPSSRRAWIEMLTSLAMYGNLLVALLAEGVDRNAE